MAELFERAIRLTAGGLQVTGLRAQLRVMKTAEKEPNTAAVTVFNLSEQSRAAMQKKGLKVIVEAGYTGTIAQLFSGDARQVDHVREGPSWLTKIQCGDGETAYQYATVSENFRPGTAFGDVFAKVARATGWDVTDATATVRAAVPTVFRQGYAACGRASAEVDRLLRGRGLEWSVQDGRLQVLGLGKVTRETAVVLSAATGLIGSPALGTPAKKGKPALMKIKSLLQPELRPGRRVRVQATAVNGDFRVVTVTHSGDTHGQEWYSEIECSPIST